MVGMGKPKRGEREREGTWKEKCKHNQLKWGRGPRGDEVIGD